MSVGSTPVKTGLDILLAEGFKRLKGRKIALLAHQASVNAELDGILDLMQQAELDIRIIFGPEHGFAGTAQDMEMVESDASSKIGVPIVSLYGNNKESLQIDVGDLDDVDVLVCDLQDVGSRYYTFANTIGFALKSCALANISCLVLDRPNPINANDVEGNLVDPEFQSFVGAYPIANRHGLTIGELASFFNAFHNEACELEVVWMEGYRRTEGWSGTNLPWVSPSPNMPSPTAANLYPGGCLIEGTNLSEGRGTTQPFELYGAPYITNSERFAALLESQNLLGVKFRPLHFKPVFQKHAHQDCGGVQVHITNLKLFEPLKTGVGLIWAAKHFDGYQWRQEPYEFENDKLAIDLLFGSDIPRQMLDNSATPEDIMQNFLEEKRKFISMRSKFLHGDYQLR